MYSFCGQIVNYSSSFSGEGVSHWTKAFKNVAQKWDQKRTQKWAQKRANNSDPKCLTDPKADPTADPKADPKADPEADPKADPKCGPKSGPNMWTQNVDPKLRGPKTWTQNVDPKLFVHNHCVLSVFLINKFWVHILGPPFGST